ncbi:hypothetical protein [Blastochloris tepida]|nr:hypothetical protein [Blastochloris tepida]
MTLAALEAYVLGDSVNAGSRKRNKSVETFGYIWGVKRCIGDGEIVIYLDRSSTSISAEKNNRYVTPNKSAAKIKNTLINLWSPHLSFLGSFHTHPYRDLREVKDCRGWEFSEADLDAFDCDDFLWGESGDNPVDLVMTVCKLQRIREKFNAETIDDNICCFDACEFRFWINVNVGYTDGRGIRYQTYNNKKGKVMLDIDNYFYNSKFVEKIYDNIL